MIGLDEIDFEDLMKSIPEGLYPKASPYVYAGPFIPLMTTEEVKPVATSWIKERYTKSGPKNLLTEFRNYFGRDKDFDTLIEILKVCMDLGFAVKTDDGILWKHNA